MNCAKFITGVCMHGNGGSVVYCLIEFYVLSLSKTSCCRGICNVGHTPMTWLRAQRSMTRQTSDFQDIDKRGRRASGTARPKESERGGGVSKENYVRRMAKHASPGLAFTKVHAPTLTR